MKKKLLKKTLAIVIVNLFLLSGITTTSAIKLENKKNNNYDDNDFYIEITVYVYYDYNKNGTQDAGEFHATNVWVSVIGGLPTAITPSGKVDPETGEVKLKIPTNVNIFPTVYAYENGPRVAGYLSSDQYKNTRHFEFLKDGQYVTIGMTYHEKKAKNIEKSKTIFDNFFEDYPLLLRLIQRFFNTY